MQSNKSAEFVEENEEVDERKFGCGRKEIGDREGRFGYVR